MALMGRRCLLIPVVLTSWNIGNMAKSTLSSWVLSSSQARFGSSPVANALALRHAQQRAPLLAPHNACVPHVKCSSTSNQKHGCHILNESGVESNVNASAPPRFGVSPFLWLGITVM